MLKSNCKQARENIAAYILQHYDDSNYDYELEPIRENYPAICAAVLATMRDEKKYDRTIHTDQARFIDWICGLPSLLGFEYMYRDIARRDLAAILDETPEEAERFTESQAEEMLTKLVYRELTRCAA